MYEDDLKYAKQRLEGTIVRIGEEPVVVDYVGVGAPQKRRRDPVQAAPMAFDWEAMPQPMAFAKAPVEGLVEASVTYLKDKSTEGVTLDKLNLEPVPLGYLNYKNQVYYMARKPMRNDWRQGLRTANMAFIGAEGFYDIPFTEFRNTVLDIYPTVVEIKDRIKRKIGTAMSFSRDFALSSRPDGDDFLHYRGKVVGSMNMLPVLQENFKYLTEYLQEVLDAKRA